MRQVVRLIIAVFVLVLFVSAQEKPRVFVQGKGSQDVNSDGAAAGGHHWGTWGSRTTIDSHDESMEVTKDLQKDCSGVIVTLNSSNADYTVLLNRESKKNRGLLRSNNQIEVANKAGDILGTGDTHSVGNATKDACKMIVADWQSHGPSPAAAASGPEVKPAENPAPAQKAETATPAVAPNGTVVAATAASAAPDAATAAKQHQECLALAKDNPSIVCK